MVNEDKVDEDVAVIVSARIDLVEERNNGLESGHPPPAVTDFAMDLYNEACAYVGVDKSTVPDELSYVLEQAVATSLIIGNRLAEKGVFVRDMEQCDCFTIPEGDLEKLLEYHQHDED